VLADRAHRRKVTAWQPEGHADHPLRIDVAPRHADAVTAGYIIPARIDDDGRYAAEYLAQRTAL